MDLAFVFQMCPSEVAIQGHSPITLGVCSEPLGVGQVLNTEESKTRAKTEFTKTPNSPLKKHLFKHVNTLNVSIFDKRTR